MKHDSMESGLNRIVLNTIKKYELIKKGDGIIVGLSGGPDSVCLLHVLHSLREELNISLFALHVNHMLRGEESAADQTYSEELCRRLDIPIKVIAADVAQISKQKGISLEEAGRELRYENFEAYAQETGATKIAVAHNKNDQAETVLMHIIRGTGLEGLKGMEYRRDKVIRPLMGVDRKSIEDYCIKNSLNPRTDSSNLKEIYTRNKIRLQLIPYISNMFETDISDVLVRMCGLVKEDHQYIESEAQKAYKDCTLKIDENETVLDTSKLESLHTAISKRVLRYAYREIKGNMKGLESIHTDSMLELALRGRTGAEISLPENIRVQKSYGIIKVYREHEAAEVKDYNKRLEIPGMTELYQGGPSIEASILETMDTYGIKNNLKQNSREQFFDYDILIKGINIRKRKEGDIFKPYKANGTKKLKEYFIDCKIPRQQRDKILLIAIDNEIVWIIGYKTSDKFKVTENTKRVLKLKFLSEVQDTEEIK